MCQEGVIPLERLFRQPSERLLSGEAGDGDEPGRASAKWQRRQCASSVLLTFVLFSFISYLEEPVRGRGGLFTVYFSSLYLFPCMASLFFPPEEPVRGRGGLGGGSGEENEDVASTKRLQVSGGATLNLLSC
jgi:hypothetical protein